jgi:hypothetical protein
VLDIPSTTPNPCSFRLVTLECFRGHPLSYRSCVACQSPLLTAQTSCFHPMRRVSVVIAVFVSLQCVSGASFNDTVAHTRAGTVDGASNELESGSSHLRGGRSLSSSRCPSDWLYYKDSDLSEGRDSCLKEFDASLLWSVSFVSHAYANHFCRSLAKYGHLVTFRSNKRFDAGDTGKLSFLYKNLVSPVGHAGCRQRGSVPFGTPSDVLTGNTGDGWFWVDNRRTRNLLCKAPSSDEGCPDTLWATAADPDVLNEPT